MNNDASAGTRAEEYRKLALIPLLHQLDQRQLFRAGQHIRTRAELCRLHGETSKGAKVFGRVEEGDDGVGRDWEGEYDGTVRLLKEG